MYFVSFWNILKIQELYSNNKNTCLANTHATKKGKIGREKNTYEKHMYVHDIYI